MVLLPLHTNYTKLLRLSSWVAVFTLTFILRLNASGAEPKILYQQAAAHYKAGEYEVAAKHYEQLLKLNYKLPEVYYNAGNCYYKLNQTGRAILNYERALRLSPDDEEIQDNLRMAEMKAVDKIDAVPQLSVITWWKKFTSSHSSRGWGLPAVICLWLALAMAAVYLFIGLKKVALPAGIALFVLSLAFVSLAAKQHNEEQYSNQAILMVTSAFVKSAPDTNGSNAFMIHEGIKFSILDNVGTWYKIRLADGKTGWVESTSFSRI